MKEELLTKIKEELQSEKQKLIDYNNNIKRIRELQNDANVQEFLNLTNLSYERMSLKKVPSEDLIELIFSSHLYEIDERDSNGIYVYLGTYQYTDEVDIVHAAHDISVPYDSPVADYRVYHNIEQLCSEMIPISECDNFEKTHTILNKKRISNKGFYVIQRDFFIRAIKVDQISAKKMVLRKYLER